MAQAIKYLALPHNYMETTINELQQIVDEQKPEVKLNTENKPKMREFIIQTDGQNINTTKNEWTSLELIAGLSMLLNKINNK
jgi:hypothetical protein